MIHQDHYPQSQIRGVISSGGSHKRVKNSKNDDRHLIKVLDSGKLLLAVSDGMGGHPAGDVAAEDIIACLNLIKSDSENGILSLVTAINQADVSIRNRVRKAMIFEGMGATATSIILNRGKVWWAHIGDSRLYLLSGGVLQQVTKDHSFLQDLIDSGDISEQEAAAHPMAHVLDQCVGSIDGGVDCGTFRVSPGDFIILCTDGLYRVVPDSHIASVAVSTDSVSDCVAELISLAVKQGPPDDTTIVVAHVSDSF
jgi:serine/threonine protein phosphatase PrpC